MSKHVELWVRTLQTEPTVLADLPYTYDQTWTDGNIFTDFYAHHIYAAPTAGDGSTPDLSAAVPGSIVTFSWQAPAGMWWTQDFTLTETPALTQPGWLLVVDDRPGWVFNETGLPARLKVTLPLAEVWREVTCDGLDQLRISGGRSDKLAQAEPASAAVALEWPEDGPLGPHPRVGDLVAVKVRRPDRPDSTDPGDQLPAFLGRITDKAAEGSILSLVAVDFVRELYGLNVSSNDSANWPEESPGARWARWWELLDQKMGSYMPYRWTHYPGSAVFAGDDLTARPGVVPARSGYYAQDPLEPMKAIQDYTLATFYMKPDARALSLPKPPPQMFYWLRAGTGEPTGNGGVNLDPTKNLVGLALYEGYSGASTIEAWEEHVLPDLKAALASGQTWDLPVKITEYPGGVETTGLVLTLTGLPTYYEDDPYYVAQPVDPSSSGWQALANTTADDVALDLMLPLGQAGTNPSERSPGEWQPLPEGAPGLFGSLSEAETYWANKSSASVPRVRCELIMADPPPRRWQNLEVFTTLVEWSGILTPPKDPTDPQSEPWVLTGSAAADGDIRARVGHRRMKLDTGMDWQDALALATDHVARLGNPGLQVDNVRVTFDPDSMAGLPEQDLADAWALTHRGFAMCGVLAYVDVTADGVAEPYFIETASIEWKPDGWIITLALGSAQMYVGTEEVQVLAQRDTEAGAAPDTTTEVQPKPTRAEFMVLQDRVSLLESGGGGFDPGTGSRGDVLYTDSNGNPAWGRAGGYYSEFRRSSRSLSANSPRTIAFSSGETHYGGTEHVLDRSGTYDLYVNRKGVYLITVSVKVWGTNTAENRMIDLRLNGSTYNRFNDADSGATASVHTTVAALIDGDRLQVDLRCGVSTTVSDVMLQAAYLGYWY